MRIVRLCSAVTMWLGWSAFAVQANDEPPKPNPKSPVDYVTWMNESIGKGIAQNAADKYRIAFDHLVARSNELEFIGTNRWLTRDWKKDEETAIRAWIVANEGCIADFAEASRVVRCYFRKSGPGHSMVEVRMPYLPQARECVRVVALRARLRFESGDVSGAMSDMDTMLRAGRHLAGQHFLIEHLTGRAITSMAYAFLHSGRLASLTAEQLAQVVSRLDMIDTTPNPPLNAALGEWAMLLDCGQRYLVDDDNDGRFEKMNLPKIDDAEGRQLLHDPPITFQEFESRARTFHDRSRKLFTADYSTARRLSEELMTDVKIGRATLFQIFVPDMWRPSQLDRYHTARRNATRLVLALRQCKASGRPWPASMQELAVKELTPFRRDPFSSADLVYRIENGEPLLYSVGENGKDDGGKRPDDPEKEWDAEGDAVFWPAHR